MRVEIILAKSISENLTNSMLNLLSTHKRLKTEFAGVQVAEVNGSSEMAGRNAEMVRLTRRSVEKTQGQNPGANVPALYNSRPEREVMLGLKKPERMNSIKFVIYS